MRPCPTSETHPINLVMSAQTKAMSLLLRISIPHCYVFGIPSFLESSGLTASASTRMILVSENTRLR